MRCTQRGEKPGEDSGGFQDYKLKNVECPVPIGERGGWGINWQSTLDSLRRKGDAIGLEGI